MLFEIPEGFSLQRPTQDFSLHGAGVVIQGHFQNFRADRRLVAGIASRLCLLQQGGKVTAQKGISHRQHETDDMQPPADRQERQQQYAESQPQLEQGRPALRSRLAA